MQRIESQISSLQQRHAELQQVVADSEAPLKEMEEELGQALRSRQEAEEKLNDARKQVQDIEHAMREASDENGKADQHVQ